MKIKSLNWLYLLVTVPFLALDFCLGIWLARNILWLWVLLTFVGISVIVAVCRKFAVMPKALETYGDCQTAELTLPVNANVELYWSKQMTQYPFLHRVVEVVVPLVSKSGIYKVMINPQMQQDYGDVFLQIAVMRELESLRRGISFKSFASLVLPFELLIACVLAVAGNHARLEAILGGFVLNFACPTLAVALFAIALFFWNRSISIQDTKLDCYLLAHFSKEEIEEYICITENMLAGGGKEKEFMDHYKQKRLENLRNQSSH